MRGLARWRSCCPNIQQVAPIWETGKVEHGFVGPMMTRWIVPIDNTNTMFVEFDTSPTTSKAFRPGGTGATRCCLNSFPKAMCTRRASVDPATTKRR